MIRKFGLTLAGVGVLALGLVAAGVGPALGGHIYTTITGTTGTTTGHTPVTFCHKPGTPAEQELTTDDDGFLEGHLGHGDTLGPCPTTTTTETTPTDTIPTIPTTTTETTPTETTPTTPGPSRCPPGQGPYAGKDGQSGNDECCPDANNDQVCDATPTAPPETSRVTPVQITTQATTTPTATTATPTTKPTAATKPPVVQQVKPKPDKPRTSAVKHAEKHVKLTGNPKKDKCKNMGNGVMRCKGVVVVAGSG